MADKFITFIVTAQDAPLARQIAASFGPGGRGMWETALSPTGLDPATHYISTGLVPPRFYGLITDPAAIAQISSARGLTINLKQVRGLLDRSDVTEQPPFTAMARLGLKIINPPMET
jgi:hypothetical protein